MSSLCPSFRANLAATRSLRSAHLRKPRLLPRQRRPVLFISPAAIRSLDFCQASSAAPAVVVPKARAVVTASPEPFFSLGASTSQNPAMNTSISSTCFHYFPVFHSSLLVVSTASARLVFFPRQAGAPAALPEPAPEAPLCRRLQACFTSRCSRFTFLRLFCQVAGAPHSISGDSPQKDTALLFMFPFLSSACDTTHTFTFRYFVRSIFFSISSSFCLSFFLPFFLSFCHPLSLFLLHLSFFFLSLSLSFSFSLPLPLPFVPSPTLPFMSFFFLPHSVLRPARLRPRSAR